MALFIACHKQTELPNHECYIPIHAGKKISGKCLIKCWEMIQGIIYHVKKKLL